MPNLFVIAGCNGAGKTTISKTLLPKTLGVKEFVNADEIARGISPFNPEGAAFTAGRVMLERIGELAARQEDFAIETTLASKTYAAFFSELKERGYEIIILFVFLSSPQEAIKRVRQRVKEGGHDVANDVIVRRYNRGLRNFIKVYSAIADRWVVFDNSLATPIFVAERKKGKIAVADRRIWELITTINE